MTDANGEFVKVYLYLVRILNSGRAVTVADIADHFNLTEKDICRAIKYWISHDVLRLEYNQMNRLSGITLLPLEPKRNFKDLDNIAIFTAKNKPVLEEPQAIVDTIDVSEKVVEIEEDYEEEEEEISIPEKVKYSPKDILKKKKEDKAFGEIIYQLETFFNRPLTSTDSMSLIYIYEELGFSAKLLEYLIEFCVTSDKKSLRYMEKVAMDWYEKGINTVAKAKKSVVNYNSMYTTVLRQLGISRKTPTSIETEYINTWYQDYAFDKTVVLEACKRAITKNPQSANFAYVNGILESWHKQNVRNLSDIDALDKKWEESKKNNAKKKQTRSVNQFNNFTQKKMDDELDVLDKLFEEEVNSN